MTEKMEHVSSVPPRSSEKPKKKKPYTFDRAIRHARRALERRDSRKMTLAMYVEEALADATEAYTTRKVPIGKKNPYAEEVRRLRRLKHTIAVLEKGVVPKVVLAATGDWRTLYPGTHEEMEKHVAALRGAARFRDPDAPVSVLRSGSDGFESAPETTLRPLTTREARAVAQEGISDATEPEGEEIVGEAGPADETLVSSPEEASVKVNEVYTHFINLAEEYAARVTPVTEEEQEALVDAYTTFLMARLEHAAHAHERAIVKETMNALLYEIRMQRAMRIESHNERKALHAWVQSQRRPDGSLPESRPQRIISGLRGAALALGILGALAAAATAVWRGMGGLEVRAAAASVGTLPLDAPSTYQGTVEEHYASLYDQYASEALATLGGTRDLTPDEREEIRRRARHDAGIFHVSEVAGSNSVIGSESTTRSERTPPEPRHP